jgi:polygalacturonase
MMRASWILFLPILLGISAVSLAGADATYNIKDFGAIGDGVTKDTAAFQKALDTCAVSGGGKVVVPAGKFLIGSVQIGYETILQLEKDSVIIGSSDLADYPMIDIRWEGRWQPGHRALIYAANVDHTGIVGPGTIEGNGAVAAGQNPRGVVVLEPVSCHDVRWEDFSVTQGGNWTTHPTYCSDVVIKNVNIRSNRDGIDIDSCEHVHIEGCDIDTGDDSISLKSGRGLNGARLGKPTEEVLISHCKLCGRNYACLGIGSETSGGIRNIRIDHCELASKTFGVYIKTRIGRAGTIEDIVGEDLDVQSGGFLRVNLISSGNVNTVDDPVEGPLGYPTAKNLKFSNIRLHDATVAAEATQIAEEKPVLGFSLSNLSGTAAKGISLQHIRDAALSNNNLTVASGPLLAIADVTGTGLEGAVTYAPPKARANDDRNKQKELPVLNSLPSEPEPKAKEK